MSSSTLAMTLGYRGARFAGWAVQSERTTRGRPTVQATVEGALAQVLGHPVRVTAAGRTDAGVHAEGQVVSFETASNIPPAGLCRAVSSRLPEDIWPIEAHAAPPGFHARRSAQRRWYRYHVWNAESAPRLAWQGRSLMHAGRLDLAAMRRASRSLIGRLDAASFATHAPAGRSTRRTIFAADWLQPPSSPLLTFEICADAFLRGMVRTLVGSLLWVGRGHWSPADFFAALNAADRRAAGPSAPPHGLTLHRVDYQDLRYPDPCQ